MIAHPAEIRGHTKRLRRSAFRACAVAVAIAGGFICTGPEVRATDPIPAAGSPTPGTPVVSDVVLARSALAALDADPQMRSVSLVVSVVDRIAVIGGPVPSAQHATRAEELVRRVHGIVDVKNRCFVQTGPDPLVRVIASSPVPTAQTLLADLPGVVPGPKPGASTEPIVRQPEPDLTSPLSELPGTTVVARKPVIPSGDMIGLLLPPVAANGATPVPVPASGPAVLTASPAVPVIAAQQPRDVLAAADVVRKSNPRFAGLTTELRDGTLVIGGTAPRAADAWEFAQAVRRVPGIARVVVGAVDVK